MHVLFSGYCMKWAPSGKGAVKNLKCKMHGQLQQKVHALKKPRVKCLKGFSGKGVLKKTLG